MCMWHSSSGCSRKYGFTLIELLMVIVLLGVMAVGITGFIGLSTQTYVNVSERDELLASARFAVERLNREIRNAVPNSLRVLKSSTSDVQCVEFVPILASASYIDIPVLPEPGATSVQVLPFVDQQGAAYQCSGFLCLDVLTVYPLSSNDIYEQKTDGTGKTFGVNVFTPPSGASQWSLPVDSPDADGVHFDQDSPTKRLYVFNNPVSYCVRDSQLIRYTEYGFSVTQVTKPTGPKAVMADNLVSIAGLADDKLPFILYQPTLQRNAVLQVRLAFARGDEQVVFNNDIHIANVP